MSVNNPHDRFFRDSFGRPAIARDYLQHYLPQPLLRLLDLAHLKRDDRSFIDEEMKETHSDLIYQTRLTDGQEATIYFLFEHKSYPEPLVGLQLLGYMVRFWQQRLKEDLALVPIIPLVIYHGRQPWSLPHEFSALFDLPPALEPYHPHFIYHLNDFSYLSEETIQGDIWLQVCLAILRNIFKPDLREELDQLIELAFRLAEQKTGLEYIYTILYYLSSATDKVAWRDLQQALNKHELMGEQMMTTIAQELMQKGFEQGIEQGVEKGIEKGHLDAQRKIARKLLVHHDPLTVSELTDLPLTEIQALQEQEKSEE